MAAPSVRNTEHFLVEEWQERFVVSWSGSTRAAMAAVGSGVIGAVLAWFAFSGQISANKPWAFAAAGIALVVLSPVIYLVGNRHRTQVVVTPEVVERYEGFREPYDRHYAVETNRIVGLEIYQVASGMAGQREIHVLVELENGNRPTLANMPGHAEAAELCKLLRARLGLGRKRGANSIA